jgi:protein-disulfide isomerase/rhodanese-related sulfurtransferase
MRNRVLFVFCLGGAFISSYLLWSYVSPDMPLACIGAGCDVVRASRYAHFLGLPVPLYGLAMFLVLAVGSFGCGVARGPRRRIFARFLALLSGAGFLTFCYLTTIEAFVLHAWCMWCVFATILGTTIFVLALLDQKTPEPPRQPAKKEAKVLVGILAGALAAGVPGLYALVRAAQRSAARAIELATPVETGARLETLLVRPDSRRWGGGASRVTIVEFSDLQCSACRTAQETARRVRSVYGDQVQFVFRHFPLVTIHAFAWKAAEAGECAGEQGKFWEAIDYFFDHQEDLSVRALERYAGAIGLDTAKFQDCLDSSRMSTRVGRDLEDARVLGLRVAPTFVIEGRVIPGAIPFPRMAALLDQALAARASVQRPTASETGTSQPQLSTSARSGNASLPTETPAFGSRPLGMGEVQGEETSCSEEAATQPEAAGVLLDEAHQAFLSGDVLFVDVREPDAYRAGHIRGARSLPLSQLERRLSELPRDHRVILYDDDPGGGDPCGASRTASRLLLARGYSAALVRVYREGFTRWRQAGYPATP